MAVDLTSRIARCHALRDKIGQPDVNLGQPDRLGLSPCKSTRSVELSTFRPGLSPREIVKGQ
jgi:hypothetical protein